MADLNRNALFAQLQDRMAAVEITNWEGIQAFLQQTAKTGPPPEEVSCDTIHEQLGRGAAFITYDFGIDGVSIEIFKYAECLERIFAKSDGTLPLHFIGGDFHDKADVVLKPEWNRFRIPGMNGWSKWYGGKWFSKLYYEPMPEGSVVSDEVAQEIWRQAVDFAGQLGQYLTDKDVSLLIPVNIPTNPGNLAIMLAIVMVTEGLGTYVISSNHDYYWEGGKPAAEHEPGEEPGPRDHFFKNMDNKPFFELFKLIYPWDGKRWLQVNINTPQSEALVDEFGFDKSKVFELGTAISDEFFEDFTSDDQTLIRKKMAYILSDGSPTIKTVNIKSQLNSLDNWMRNQKPIACGYGDGLLLDPTTDKTIYCLQPTRVIARKRIELDLEMLQALFHYKAFRRVFERDPDYQMVIHITGPVPIEHQEDLETILKAYMALCDSVPEDVARRVFIAFSVGTEDHPSLAANNLESLCIEEIYRLATLILFPSETEGRGLPIVESSADGIPIVCSRYYPEEVFAEVVGEDLSKKEQIEYTLFPEPEEGYSNAFLQEITDLMLHQDMFVDRIEHNKKAVRLRYSSEMIERKFELFIETLRKLD